MKRHVFAIVVLTLSLLFNVDTANAWWSVPYYSGGESTHFRLGQAALTLVAVDSMQYPDLYKFRVLSDGRGIVPWMSGSTDDSNAHGKRYEAGKPRSAAAYNGGPIERWWGIYSPEFPDPSHGVLPQYKLFNFSSGDYSAYYYLAMMAHLVGDQAVPAHAGNISHYNPTEFVDPDSTTGDNFENAASFEQPQQCLGSCHVTAPVKVMASSYIISYYKDPDQGIIRSTQDQLPGWKTLNGAYTYWIGNTSYVGGAFDEQHWGHYGGENGEDYYTKPGDSYDIIQKQFTQSVSYMAGFLEAASKSLPPLVRNFRIPSATTNTTPADIDMVRGTEITYEILENRDPIVWLTIKAIDTISHKEYLVRQRSSVLLHDGVDLPNEGTFYLHSWRGEFEGGGVLPDGIYAMRIEVEDSDGNEVNKVYSDINTDSIDANNTQRYFRIDTPPPQNPPAPTVRGGNGKATVTWTAPKYNTDGSSLTDLAGFRVYWSTARSRTGALTTDLLPVSQRTIELSLTNGQRYFVTVTAVDSRGNESEPLTTQGYSDWSTVIPLDKVIWVHKSGGPSGSYTSINAALAAANSGSIKTVMVGPGNYTETELTIGLGSTPANITLRSERGPAETTIDGQSDTAFEVKAGNYCRIIGFTIRHASEQGTGISCFIQKGVLISNNIFIANGIGVYVTGAITTGIHNNVFQSNYTGIYATTHYGGLVEVFNNIFQDNSSAAIEFDWVYGFSVQYNDFSGTGKYIWEDYGRNENDIYRNFYFPPDFISTSSNPPDYHLEKTSRARNSGANFDYIDPVTKENRVWEECDPTKKRADLGAFGGPFAYIDNNLNSIPDCDEVYGNSTTVAMLQNTLDYPIQLTGRSPQATNPTSSLAAPAGAGTLSDLTFTIVTGPDHGTLSGTAPALTYTPAPGYTGADAFSFTAAGEMGVSEPALVNITVKASNSPPAAVDQTVRLKPNAALAVTLLGSDADGDGLTFAVDSSPSSGALQCLMPPDCAFRPEYGFTGEVSFTYHANDGIADSAPATVRIFVSAEPGIVLVAPAKAYPGTNASSFTITWTETDPGGSGTIALYRDRDAYGFDGELIVADIPASDPANAYTWDIAGLSDGTYYVYAAIRNAGGTALVYAPGPLIIDRTAPLVTADPGDGMYGAAQSVTLSTNEPATIYATTDGSAPTVSSPLYEEPIAVSESLTLRWIAVDAVGNQCAQDSATYRIESPPALDPIGDKTVNVNQTLSFTVTATDPDGTTPSLSVQNLPPGADFSGGTFTWTPTCDQSGAYPVTFVAADGEFQDTELVTITVVHVNRAPTVPLISAPQTQSEVQTVRPNLVLENSVDPDADLLRYEYEVYADEAMTNIVAYGSAEEQPSLTSWTVTADLADNTRYFWRARAADGATDVAAFSQWTDANFFVNVANDPPGPFAAASPAEGADVAVLAPELRVTNSSDLDGDALWYSFFVYTDEGLTNLVGSATGIRSGTGGSTSWTVSPPLADNTWHFWKAAATDEHGLTSETAPAAFFVNTANDAPTTPTVASPVDGAEVAATNIPLNVGNASDLDGDILTYFFELDSVATFDGPGRVASDPVAPGFGTTSWSVTNLAENTRYYWRCKAVDGWVESPWATASFFVNLANDAPGAPTPRNPGAGARVESVTPRLEIYAASDPDFDTLVYNYEVFAEPLGSPVAVGNTTATEWVVTPPLADNSWHSWRARAVDEHGLTGPWTSLTAFFTNNNGVDDPPTITVTEPATAYVQAGGTFTIAWVDGDPDSDAAIALYRDGDSVGLDGKLIVSGLSEDQDGPAGSYIWNLSGVPAGTYHIYGVISDGTSSRSDYAPGTVTVDGAAPTTVANPVPGTYVGQVTVRLTATDDADPRPVIRYTVNGTTPTLASPIYTAPLTFTATTTLRFFAVDASGRQETIRGPYVYTIAPPTYTAVTLLAPNGGEVIASGSTYTIRWGAPSNAISFDLAYSTNNGGSYTNIATGRTGSSYNWTVPKPAANSPQCRVKVTGKGSKTTVGNDTSDQVFTIEVIRVTSPNGGESYSRAATPTRAITWVTNGTNQTANKVVLSYSTNGGSSWTTITTLSSNPGIYTWPLPRTNSYQYRVRVQLFRGNTALGSDTSNANFTIGP